MHARGADNALHHLDFAVIDLILMQLSFNMAFWITGHTGLVYRHNALRLYALVLFIVQLSMGLFSDIYRRIYTRNARDEYRALLRNVALVWLLSFAFVIIAQLPVHRLEMILGAFVFFDTNSHLKHRHNPLPASDTMNDTGGQIFNDGAEAINNMIQGFEDLISKATLSDFLPDLLDGIHLRRIRWDKGQCDSIRYF